VAGERGVADVQREMEQARGTLASAIDELAYRMDPQRLKANLKQTLRTKAQTPQGKAVIAGVAALLLLRVVRRMRRH
jgi:hypothetical protein